MAKRFVAVFLALLLAPLPALAQRDDDDKEKKKSFVVTEKTFKKLNEAHELISAEKYQEAKRVIDGLADDRGLNDHEHALVWQTYGYIWSSLENYGRATAAFEKTLSFDALPEGAQLNTLYNLAQLYMANEQFQKGVLTLKRWFARAENPAPDAYYLLALGYVQQDRFDLALPHAKTAVQKSDKPKEAWLQLLLALYLDKKQYKDGANLLEQLVARFPRKTYWMQLSAVYQETGREKDALAVMQIAYEQGFLSEDRELRNLVQMYLFHEVPYHGAKILEKGIAEGIVKKDAKAYELLANAWVGAREYDRAIPPLRRAAQLSDKGELFMRLGQVYLEREDWKEAREALAAAEKKGGLKDPGQNQLLLGIAQYNSKRLTAARRAFERARGYEKTARPASQWLRHIEREQAQAAAAAAAAEQTG